VKDDIFKKPKCFVALFFFHHALAENYNFSYHYFMNISKRIVFFLVLLLPCTSCTTTKDINVALDVVEVNQKEPVNYPMAKYLLLDKPDTWPEPRFIDNGNFTLTDRLTGLIWEKQPIGFEMSWEDALGYCNTLRLGGYKDWRLPNRRELLSLVHVGEGFPVNWFNSQGFIGLQEDYYWSSTTYSSDTNDAWYVNFFFGEVEKFDKSFGCDVLAVRRPPSETVVDVIITGQTKKFSNGDDGDQQENTFWSKSQFKDNGNGTLTDKLTGLIWEKKPSDKKMYFQESLTYCDTLTTGGFSDWRLPTRIELESLVNAGKNSPAEWLNSQGFSGLQADYFWSATPYALWPSSWAWYVDFYNGDLHGVDQKNRNYVLAVRQEQLPYSGR
jgi:hypothetical protein